MSLADTEQRREDLLSYREEVLRELERRAGRVREIDRRIAETQHAIDALDGGRVLSGPTARVLTQEAYRRSLKKKLDGYHNDRKDASVELQRAEVRLQDVDVELSQLDAEAESAQDRAEDGETTEE